MYRTIDARPARATAARSAERAWQWCLAIADARRRGALPAGGGEASFALDDGSADRPRLVALAGAAAGEAVAPPVATTVAPPEMRWVPAGGWTPRGGWTPAARALFALYLPLLSIDAGRGFLVAHLGQSIDGRIATRSGDSQALNCKANLVHLHRLRALSDAVLIGRETASHDDPRLTTRLVSGANAVRVVIDPELRLSADLQIFTDGQATTLVVCAPPQAAEAMQRLGQDRVVAVAPGADGRLSPPAIRAALADRGLAAVFVEGGGVTVSRFIESGCADRLHVAVAPVLAGAGRDGLQLAGADLMRDGTRPGCRLFRMGSDVLWDFDLRSVAGPGSGAMAGEEASVQYIG